MRAGTAFASLAILLASLLATSPRSTQATIEQSFGDVNCDDAVSALDAAALLQLEAGLVEALECGDVADAYWDGRIDSRDAVLVLQFLAGTVNSLPPLVEAIGTLQAGVETCMGLETDSGWLTLSGDFEGLSIGQTVVARGYLMRGTVGFCPFPVVKAFSISKKVP